MRNTLEEYLETSGVSAVSCLSYRRDLEKLFSHFDLSPEKAGTEGLRTYFASLGGLLSAPSLTRHVSVVRSYYEFLRQKGILKENPMTGIRAADFLEKKIEILSRDDFERLISHPTPGFRGMRDRAMLMLLCETGLRVTELVELDEQDLSACAVICGAGKRRRVLPLSPELYRALTAYRAVAQLYSSAEERRPLFITAKGTRLTRQGFWKNLKDRAISCGVEKPLSPQTLRRSLALHLMEEGRDREEIRCLLGNADTASLRGYEIRKREK